MTDPILDFLQSVWSHPWDGLLALGAAGACAFVLYGMFEIIDGSTDDWED